MRLVGVLETVTLAVLLTNLLTIRLAPLAQAVGPVHGLLYLAGVALVWSNAYPTRSRWLAVLPGVGTLLAARGPA